ncbi:Rid family detoxifying hydrolase [Gilvibacter sp.]|uniref:Rid family detoxifying hydrolase n=1 Tax=Gilvibacter sp. TaxID=2729997 RepID=UPI003F49F12B
MAKKIINTPNAPAPIGPYSQAVIYGDLLYTSGQIAINSVTGEMVMDSIEKETRQVMENLKAVLAAADMNFDNVIKTTIFLNDMEQFAAVNAVYGEYFDPQNAPARETVQVANLPKYVNVEIGMIAGR